MSVAQCRLQIMNRNGFTFLTAIFMVMLIGIMLGLTGTSWKMIMKREREKELLFRGSQIKEAIENWYDPRYSVNGVKRQGQPHALVDLKDLLQDPYALTPVRYLPHSYATKLDEKNPKCGSECPGIKLLQDPMTGKEWDVIKCSDIRYATYELCMSKDIGANRGNAIIGVVSKSDDTPLRSKDSFKNTALENMGSVGASSTPTPGTLQTGSPFIKTEADTQPSGGGDKLTKYSEWRFIAETPQKNDHTKIYRAYHEGI